MTTPTALSTSSQPALDAAAALAYVRQVATRSGSSFLWGMRLLPRRRREAMYAIYAFCREVDDIADEGGSPAEKQQALAAWREENERSDEHTSDLQSLMRIAYADFCLQNKKQLHITTHESAIK